MPGHGSKYRRRLKKRSRCQAGLNEFCCNAITQSGTRCTRKAAVSYNLSNSMFVKILPLLKHTDCCYFCTQHMIMIINILIGKGFLWALKRTIRNIYEDPTTGKIVVGDFESIEQYAKEHDLI